MVDVTHFVDLSKDNEPSELPKATDPATREGLYWVMRRALTEALNVAKILSLDQQTADLEGMRTLTEDQRVGEQKATGTEKLR